MDVTYISTSYRDAEYLKACNRSVLGQINVRAKHMIVVDGYDSNELEEFEKSKKNCRRTIIIHNSSNKGKSACVNQAIQACQSRYIGLLDADDVIFRHKTTMQLKHLDQKKECAVVGCSYISFVDGNKKMMQFIQMPCKQEDTWQQIAFAPTSLYSSLLIDRNRYPEPALDEQLECAMDYDFNLRCLKQGTISNTPGFHCGYRIRSESITRSNKRINQLKNHANILFKQILDIDSELMNHKDHFEELYALGLSKIANESAQMQQLLRKGKEMPTCQTNKLINCITKTKSNVGEALLRERIVDVLNIGARG